MRIAAAILAVALLLAYLLPVVAGLADLALTIVVLAGLVMMGVDLWESVRETS